jgi:hypothetical protein
MSLVFFPKDANYKFHNPRGDVQVVGHFLLIKPMTRVLGLIPDATHAIELRKHITAFMTAVQSDYDFDEHRMPRAGPDAQPLRGEQRRHSLTGAVVGELVGTREVAVQCLLGTTEVSGGVVQESLGS